MKPRLLNLAAAPFVNERPVRRTSILLWILGLGLLVVNVLVIQQHVARQQQRSSEIDSMEKRRAAAVEAIETLQAELSGLELSRQNQQIEFLNGQIAKRTFSWSHLIDHLAEVLPNSVQLRGVTPTVTDPSDPRSARRAASQEQTVQVELVGETRSNAAVLEFVDALFAHPSFITPDLLRESQQQEGLTQFSLSVIYLPEREVEVAQ